MNLDATNVFRRVVCGAAALGFSLAVFLTPGCGDLAAMNDENTGKAKSSSSSSPDKAEELKVSLADSVSNRVRSGLEAEPPVSVRWSLDLNSKRVKDVWIPPTGMGYEYMLVQTNEEDLLAIDKRSGVTKWWTRLGDSITGRPYFTEFGVYVIVKGHLVSLERHSGETIWRVLLPFPAAGGPVVQEDTKKLPIVYIPALDRRVYAVEVETTIWPPRLGIHGLHRDEFQYEKPIPRIVWRYSPYSGIAGELAYSNRKVFAADTRYNVYGIIATDLSWGRPDEVQRFRTQGPMEVGPTVIGQYLLIPSRDHNLYCLNIQDMTERWRYASGVILNSEAYSYVDPHTNQTSVIIKAGKGGNMVGLKDLNGEVKWELPRAMAIVGRFSELENTVEQRSIMVVYNDDKTLSGHYATSGKELWRTPIKQFGNLVINTTEEFVFGTAEGGRIFFALEKSRF